MKKKAWQQRRDVPGVRRWHFCRVLCRLTGVQFQGGDLSATGCVGDKDLDVVVPRHGAGRQVFQRLELMDDQLSFNEPSNDTSWKCTDDTGCGSTSASGGIQWLHQVTSSQFAGVWLGLCRVGDTSRVCLFWLSGLVCSLVQRKAKKA